MRQKSVVHRILACRLVTTIIISVTVPRWPPHCEIWVLFTAARASSRLPKLLRSVQVALRRRQHQLRWVTAGLPLFIVKRRRIFFLDIGGISCQSIRSVFIPRERKQVFQSLSCFLFSLTPLFSYFLIAHEAQIVIPIQKVKTCKFYCISAWFKAHIRCRERALL